MTALRVLAWTENYWVGGSDRFLADLANGLDPAAVQLRLAGNPHPAFDEWLARRAPGLPPRAVVPIANLVHSPITKVRDRLAALSTSAASLPRPGDDTAAERGTGAALAVAGVRYGQAGLNYIRLRRLLERERPDVLHLNNGGYPGAESCRVAALAARHVGVPHIVHFVHNMAYPPNRPVRVERVLDRGVDRATDTWVTAAYRASDRLQHVRGLRRSVRTVHYGLPGASQEPVPAARREDLGFTSGLCLAVVANLEARKGHRSLFEAIALTRQRGVTVQVACVGDGAERVALEALLDELGLCSQIRLLGWRDDVPAVLAAADALCLPSLSNECLPYAILEAMQAGLPVISTDVAGIPEMILDGVTGRVVAPGNSEQLAAALEQLAQDPALLARFGAAGRARVSQDFSLERMVDEMTELWSGR